MLDSQSHCPAPDGVRTPPSSRPSKFCSDLARQACATWSSRFEDFLEHREAHDSWSNLRAHICYTSSLRAFEQPSNLFLIFHNVVRWANAYYYRPQRRFVEYFLNRLIQLYTDLLSGTDQSQGRGQIVSNINACLAVQATIKSTLGPYGGDLLMVDENGKQTITNDGATVMKVRFLQALQKSYWTDTYNCSAS